MHKVLKTKLNLFKSASTETLTFHARVNITIVHTLMTMCVQKDTTQFISATVSIAAFLISARKDMKIIKNTFALISMNVNWMFVTIKIVLIHLVHTNVQTVRLVMRALSQVRELLTATISMNAKLKLTVQMEDVSIRRVAFTVNAM